MSDSPKSSFERPGRRTFEKLGFGHGPETLERDLEGYWREFQNQPSEANGSAYAFVSLIMIYAAWERFSKTLPDSNREWGLPPQDRVPVPWWVVRLLTEGFVRYWHSDTGVTLGEAFRLEGGGQGKKPFKEMLDKSTRDWLLALDVWDTQLAKEGSGRPFKP